MRKFVKYRNRKLHEEGSKEAYLSMQELGDVVASGGEVVVVDDGTGEDLTAMTLARILYDRCREGHPVDPKAIQKILVDSRSRPRTGKAAA